MKANTTGKYIPHLRRQMQNSTHTNTFSLENNASERSDNQEPRNKYTKLSATTQNPIHFENKDIVVKIQGANIPEPVDDFKSLQLPRILVENITNADYESSYTEVHFSNSF
jgi:hypothetical protein